MVQISRNFWFWHENGLRTQNTQCLRMMVKLQQISLKYFKIILEIDLAAKIKTTIFLYIQYLHCTNWDVVSILPFLLFAHFFFAHLFCKTEPSSTKSTQHFSSWLQCRSLLKCLPNLSCLLYCCLVHYLILAVSLGKQMLPQTQQLNISWETNECLLSNSKGF